MIQILIALVSGILLGLNLSPSSTELLGLSGKLFIQMIKAVATPLLFFAILESFMTIAIKGKDLVKMVKIAAINACAALIIALLLANIFKPGQYFDLKSYSLQKGLETQTPSALSLFEKMIPQSFIAPFIENNVFTIVILAVLIGFAFKAVENSSTQNFSALSEMKGFVNVFYKILEKILHWLTKLVPIAVLGVTAKAVGDKGLGVFTGLLSYVLLCTVGLFLQMVLIYFSWIHFYLKIPLSKFLKETKSALAHAFGVNSSLATLHMTLSSAERLGASPHAARIVSCVGTNLNNDGILLYEAAAVLFIAQSLGMDLSLLQQLSIMLTCMIAALGVSGIPEAGIISLTLVMAANGMPVEVIPILLSVDWFVARLRSVTNVMSDITGSLVLNHQIKR